MTLPDAYYWSTMLVSLGICQATIADLAISLKHKAITNFHLSTETMISRYMRGLQFAFNGEAVWLLKTANLILAIGTIAMVFSGLNPRFLLLTILLIHLVSYPRWRYFVSSDAPLLRAILIALLLHYFQPSSQVIAEAGLVFIALYLSLIYLLAAIQKLKSPLWINGDAIINFTKRFAFWSNIVSNIKLPTILFKLSAWSVMLFELCFFVGLIWPESITFFLAGGLFFHGLLSFSTGINHFLWTFIAAYPACFYLAGKLPEVLNRLAGL